MPLTAIHTRKDWKSCSWVWPGLLSNNVIVLVSCVAIYPRCVITQYVMEGMGRDTKYYRMSGHGLYISYSLTAEKVSKNCLQSVISKESQIKAIFCFLTCTHSGRWCFFWGYGKQSTRYQLPGRSGHTHPLVSHKPHSYPI